RTSQPSPTKRSPTERAGHTRWSYVHAGIVRAMVQPVVYFPEPDPPDLTRPRWGERPLDWYARSFECVSKKYNQEAQAEIDRNADMANMLDEVGPHLWAISFRTLPKAMTTAEFQPYVDRATEFYATLPTAVDGGDHIPYEWMGEHGLMRL